jgi:putative endonuclease
MNHCKTGRDAEQLAVRFLRARGYRILKTNWRWGKKELDIVATCEGVLIVVEVKSMVDNRINHPYEVVDQRKQRHLVSAAEGFIRVFNSRIPTRFDVIAVIYNGGQVEIEHIIDAFRPEIE